MDNNGLFEIKEGHDYSSYFWFYGYYDQETNIYEEFSIEEEYFHSYIMPFLEKHIKIPFGYLQERYVSRNMINKMCNEIESICNLLNTNFNDKKLDIIKNNMSIFYIATKKELTEIDVWNMKGDEQMKFIETKVYRIIDFYERFIKRIKLLSNNNGIKDGLIKIGSP